MKRKRSQPPTMQKKIKTQDNGQSSNQDPVLGTVFRGLTFHIHPANFGVGRLRIFEKQVKKFGGNIMEFLPQDSEDLTHIVFEESIDSERVKKLLDPAKYPNAVFVKCMWLSLCIKTKSREMTKDHEIIIISKTPGKSKSKVESSLSSKAGDTGDLKDAADPDSPFSVHDDAMSSHGEGSGSEHLKDITSHTLSGSTSTAYLQKHADAETECNSTVIDIKCQISDLKSKDDDELDSLRKPREIAAPTTEEREIEDKIEWQGNAIQSKETASLIKPFPKYLQQKFACSQPSSSKTKGFNSHITSELEKLATTYKSKNDTWRAMGYQKAISAIRNYPKEITSREEALKIRGVGARLADKVAEIVESGKLRKVAEVCDGEEAQTLKLFMGVWGAGPTTAQSWYIQGFRTLEELQTKATLTRHQQIGLKYYDDINSRIPREEVVEIETYVREAALSVKKGLIVDVCGSYRRGRPTCGDVDVLITHPDGHSHNNLFRPILQRLKDTGFLTDDLVTQEDNGNQQKYLGVCVLPGKDRKHRRLDVIVVPYAEYAPALMYFTGSAHFNRSMRLLAVKMGMSLSEHGLRAGIIRQGREKLTAGSLLDTPTEESIFAHLGLEYRTPQERDH